MIECKNLIKKYNKVTVVSNLSFHVNRGEIYGLLGANGAGRTTTIKMILGLTKIDGGEIIMPKDISIGYSPETPYFYPFLTGAETLAFYSKIQKIRRTEAKQQIEEILEKVGLASSAQKKVQTYSKGMLQRLAVGQSLLGNPELLILDEPTSGLDALGRLEMKNLILELKREGKTIILNSHILSDVEKVADTAIILKEGKQLTEVDLQNKDRNVSLEDIFIRAIRGIQDASHHHEMVDPELLGGSKTGIEYSAWQDGGHCTGACTASIPLCCIGFNLFAGPKGSVSDEKVYDHLWPYQRYSGDPAGLLQQHRTSANQ